MAVREVISFSETSTIIALPRESKWVKSFAKTYLLAYDTAKALNSQCTATCIFKTVRIY